MNLRNTTGWLTLKTETICCLLMVYIPDSVSYSVSLDWFAGRPFKIHSDTPDRLHCYVILQYTFLFLLWRCDPTRVMASSFLRFLDHTQRRTTVGRTPPDEWSARRRDLYLTTHDTHNRQTSMHRVEFKPIISAGERPYTCALDRAAPGRGL